MANVNCPSYLQGFSVRATQLDECGVPVEGPCGMAVSDGYIQAVLTPNVEDPDEFKQKNAHGVYLVNQRSRPLLNWIDISIQFQQVDFELWSIITGLPTIPDDTAITPLTMGIGVTESAFATGSVAIELWEGNNEQACAPGELPYYGYSLLPWVVEGALAEDITITNATITFTINSRTRKGTPWGVGPYDVVLDNAAAPSPLFEALPDDAHLWQLQTQVAPPEPVCGCQDLVVVT